MKKAADTAARCFRLCRFSPFPFATAFVISLVMNAKAFRSLSSVLLAMVLAGEISAQTPQITFPAGSPACTLNQRVGLMDITVVYSRPSAKGRAIFGGIVPYGQVWRTGANQATKLTFSTPVKLEGHEIPAGTYALFTIPGESEWTIIVSTNINQWGSFKYDQKDDLVRFKVKHMWTIPPDGGVVPPGDFIQRFETFTIEFREIRDESAVLTLAWDTTVVPIHLEVDVSSKLVPQIEAEMTAPGKKVASLDFQAATFYYNHSRDMTRALEWLNDGLADNPNIAYEMLHLKAKILAKQGDKAGAIAAAKQSSELAVKAEGPGSSFVKMNQDLISGLKP